MERIAMKSANYDTSLLAIYPELASQWDYIKNEGLRPENVSRSSHKHVWWLCEREHSWFASINNREKGKGCPYCNGRLPILGETDLITKRPELAKEWDYKKNGALKPEDVTEFSNKKVWWLCKEGHSWEAKISDRSYGNDCPYCIGKKAVINKTDLKTMYPGVAAEWDYSKNGQLKPEDFKPSSNKRVWWICGEGHSWSTAISHRTNGTRCPYCNGRLPILGVTDFKSKHPKLADEWDYLKNGGLLPENFTECSGKKVWWLCSEGHNWESTIYKRVYGASCPFCSGNKAIAGKTDLLTKHPKIAAEWDPIKNGELKPKDVTPHSNLKAWWVCKRGHSWFAVISSRTKGSSCPYCSGRKPIMGETDLATLNPELAMEWDVDKNGLLKPEHVTEFSHKEVWWTCINGHSWKARVYSRANGCGCPYCSKGGE